MQPVNPDTRVASLPFQPFTIIPGDAGCGVLVLCDHAGNALPPAYGDLGVPAAEFRRHIAYDPGAAGVSRALASALGAPAVFANFSRLLIDANRGADDPTLIMRMSDGTIIPGNARVDEREREARIALCHAPYHRAVAAAVDRALTTGRPPMIVSMHSFTPVWRGKPRPWHAGVLSDADRRLAAPLLEALRADPELVVGDNAPYSGGMEGDTLDVHGAKRGLASVIIEIRQDLIADDAGIAAWAARLAPIIREINARPEVHEVRLPAAFADAARP
jgi:predicted N-formylglutamate amidohydrolase